VLAGAGVGGGSLVYANTLYEPQTDAFFKDRQWADIADWKQELAPHYDQAKRMLGVTLNPTVTAADEVLKKVATKMGVGDSYHAAPVGVFFGRDGAKEPGTLVEDPFFGGAGPARNGCLECGECMVGCRHNAKNTLVKNYLHLAEKAGAEVLPMTTVVDVRQRTDGGYAVEVTADRQGRLGTVVPSPRGQVVLAAGTWGTQELLHRMKMSGSLPRDLRPARLPHPHQLRVDLQRQPQPAQPQGPGLPPRRRDHLVDPPRRAHPHRAGPLRPGLELDVVPADGHDRRRRTYPRPLRWLRAVLRHPLNFLALYLGIKDWSNRTIIALVMQTHDNSITVFGKKSWRGKFKLSSRQGHGEPNPTWIPAANEATRLMADEIGGAAYGSTGEIFDIPMTAHFLGGCRHRRDARGRRDRRLPPGLRPPGPARRRRLRDLRQHRREPVAHDHRPGRARHVPVAQQGRGRPAPAPRRGVPADRRGRAAVAVVPPTARGLRLPIFPVQRFGVAGVS
jgi:cholesterol oxidase